MRLFSKRATLALTAGLILFGVGIAQERDDREAISASTGNLYVVSAKPGGVNYVVGDVTITRADGTSSRLVKGEFVKIGDVVSTGASGRAEILMNPGSFVRLDHDSEFSFASTSLEDLRIKMNSGTAIFEVFASDDFKVNVEASGSNFYLVKSGVYRLDADSSGGRLEVWKGRAQAGDLNASKIKKGRSASINGDSVAISRFSKRMDEFESWSKARAKSIAKANKALASKRGLARRVVSSFRNNIWDCYSSVGLWVFNSRFRSYSFLPFGYGWRSPYGFSLGSYTEVCFYPSFYYRRPYRYPAGGGGNSGGNGGGGTTATPQANVDRGNRMRTPPFQRMQQTRSVKRKSTRGTSRFPSSSGSRGSGSTTRRSTTRSKTQTESKPAPRRSVKSTRN